MQRLCCTRMSQAPHPQSLPLFSVTVPDSYISSCCQSMASSEIWIKCAGRILWHTVCCHNLPPGLAVPLTSSVMHESFLHRSGSAGVTCGTAPPEAETGVKHAKLMSGMCSLAGLRQSGDSSKSWKQTCSCSIKWANTAGLVQETMHSDSRGKSGFAKHLGFGNHLHLLLPFQG